MRNNLFTLDAQTADHAHRVHLTVAQAMATGATIAFTATNRTTGATSARHGVVVALAGAEGMSSDSFILDTDGVPRTFNTWLVCNIVTVGE